jgi:hypothetical protein
MLTTSEIEPNCADRSNWPGPTASLDALKLVC